MGEVRKSLTIAASLAALLTLIGAGRPLALSQTSPGLWELSGLPGATMPRRQCIADPTLLARIEHRRQSCTQVVISDRPSNAVIHYTCVKGGFGQSELTVITPRSLRIETQGISAGSPFHYVIQARRIGNCDAH
jgi:hypothetical protein